MHNLALLNYWLALLCSSFGLKFCDAFRRVLETKAVLSVGHGVENRRRLLRSLALLPEPLKRKLLQAVLVTKAWTSLQH